MQRIPALIGAAMMITTCGFSETVMTAQDFAGNSDVVLESAVKEIKSVPEDTEDMIRDGLTDSMDEMETAAKGVESVFSGATPHEKVQKAAELAVENAWDTSSNLIFRSYKVSDEIGGLLLARAEDQNSPFVEVSGFFESVDFPEKTSACYMPEFNRLLVRQTMDNILSIEAVLADYQEARRELMGHQVEIETKFVEVNQSTLNELGFSWEFIENTGTGGPNPGGDGIKIFNNTYLPGPQDILAGGLRTVASALGVPTDPGVLAVGSAASENLQWRVFISALEQSDDADVLSAPRVVTLDGNAAIIQVGEEQMLPRSFDVNNQETSPYVEHADWESEMSGVSMEVTPEIREEGLIDLVLNPRITEIIGFDTYQVTEGATEVNQNIGDRPAVFASLPYMRVREMEVSVTVADGSTVGMGGLIYEKLETFRDKVPVLGSIPYLGRLFRSEGERSTKRNLMIFVTATQVDIDGRRSADVVLKK